MPADRGEPVGLMEPMLIGESSRHRTALTDLAVDLAGRAAGFRRSLPPRSGAVREAVLYRGALLRSEVPAILNASERQARRVTAALVERNVLVTDGPRAPLRLAFPAALAPRWMPGLFPVHARDPADRNRECP